MNASGRSFRSRRRMWTAITARRTSCSTALFPPRPARLAKSVRLPPSCVTAAAKQQEALGPVRHQAAAALPPLPRSSSAALASNWFGKTGPEHSGLYKLRLQASGIRPPGGQPAHLSIGKQTSEETVDGLIEFDITAPEDSPQVYEFEVFLEMPDDLHFAWWPPWCGQRGGAAFRNALASRAYIFHAQQRDRVC